MGRKKFRTVQFPLIFTKNDRFPVAEANKQQRQRTVARRHKTRYIDAIAIDLLTETAIGSLHRCRHQRANGISPKLLMARSNFFISFRNSLDRRSLIWTLPSTRNSRLQLLLTHKYRGTRENPRWWIHRKFRIIYFHG